MKILSLSTIQLLPYLGSGKTRLKWTQGLSELGHDVTVLQPPDFDFLSSIKTFTQLRTAIGIFFAVKKLLKTNQYDLIEFYGDQYWLFLIWGKYITKKKTLFVSHVDGLELLDMDKAQQFFYPRKGIKRIVYNFTHRFVSKITYNIADKYVCGCKDDLEYVFRHNIFSKNDAFCVSPAIDDIFHKMEFNQHKEKVIMFIGSWIERKGIKNIPNVITEILRQHNDYKFHVFGAWSSKNEILSSFPNDIIDRIIVFEKLDAEELYKNITTSSIFFFPSYSEGFGLATIEAMSCSCAIVTTKTGVGTQLVNNRDAILTDFDDVNSMIEAINKLINDENLRVSIAHNGYLKAKEFQWDMQIKLLEEVYRNWL